MLHLRCIGSVQSWGLECIVVSEACGECAWAGCVRVLWWSVKRVVLAVQGMLLVEIIVWLFDVFLSASLAYSSVVAKGLALLVCVVV